MMEMIRFDVYKAVRYAYARHVTLTGTLWNSEPVILPPL